MEYVGQFDLEPSDLSPLTPVQVDVDIPVSTESWSLIVTPRGPGDDVSFTLEADIGEGEFFQFNPGGGPSDALINRANIISRADSVNRVRAVLTPGATIPSGGIAIRLFHERQC